MPGGVQGILDQVPVVGRISTEQNPEGALHRTEVAKRVRPGLGTGRDRCRELVEQVGVAVGGILDSQGRRGKAGLFPGKHAGGPVDVEQQVLDLPGRVDLDLRVARSK